MREKSEPQVGLWWIVSPDICRIAVRRVSCRSRGGATLDGKLRHRLIPWVALAIAQAFRKGKLGLEYTAGES